MSEIKSEFISYMVSAISNCALYSGQHPFVSEFSERALKLAETLYIDDRLSITLLGETLYINNEPVRETGHHVKNFIVRMRRKGIERIVIEKGVDIKEFLDFLVALSGSDFISSTRHISVGVVEVKFKDDGDNISSLLQEGMDRVKESYSVASRFKRLDMVGLEEVVAGFVSALKREGNILKIMSPVKSHSEYTYVHITNVAILTIFQAELLGLKGDTLYEAGIAGLLHDIGKIYIPEGILEKKGKLSSEEWKEIKKHPSYGALFLSSLQEIPKLAVLAAFEHHIKYDGSGYPETKSYKRKPHIISQMVALADFFDAMRTHRAYRRAMGMNEVTMMIMNSKGKDFSPLVVDAFIEGLKGIKGYE